MTVQSIIVNKPTWARSLSLHSQEATLSTIKIFPFFFIFYQPSSTNTTQTPTCAHTYSFLGIGRANYEHNAPLFPKYFNDNSLKIKTFSCKINAKTTTTKTGFSLFLIELLLLSLFFFNSLRGMCMYVRINNTVQEVRNIAMASHKNIYSLSPFLLILLIYFT